MLCSPKIIPGLPGLLDSKDEWLSASIENVHILCSHILYYKIKGLLKADCAIIRSLFRFTCMCSRNMLQCYLNHNDLQKLQGRETVNENSPRLSNWFPIS